MTRRDTLTGIDGGGTLKTIVNKTRKPLRIQLHGGKTLHLGPGKTGQIADDAADEPSVKRLVKAKEIEIQLARLGVVESTRAVASEVFRRLEQLEFGGHVPTPEVAQELLEQLEGLVMGVEKA